MSTAREVMVTSFHTLNPDNSISEAIELLGQATRAEGRRVFGMMVTDHEGSLLGMISMYDILLLVRPKHIQVWGSMEDIDLSGLLESVCERAKTLLVSDIMTTELVTVGPETHLLVILDIMINKHIRRIPIVEDKSILGMVYLSDVFDYLANRIVTESAGT